MSFVKEPQEAVDMLLDETEELNILGNQVQFRSIDINDLGTREENLTMQAQKLSDNEFFKNLAEIS